MDSYAKNRDYFHHYIEEETGYSLLYSKNADRCVLLDPIATAVWKVPGETIDATAIAAAFAAAFVTDNPTEYIRSILDSMFRAGVLRDRHLLAVANEGKDAVQCTLDTINFYVTTECNSKCFHCYQPTQVVQSTTHAVGCDHVTAKTFLRLAEAALPLGLKDVKITGGEPLLRDDIGTLITRLSQLGIGITLETNAFLLTEQLASLIADHKVKLVAISLDGGSAAIHDRLRGCPGSFDRATRSMRVLSSRGCNVQAIMSLSRLNIGEIESTIHRAAESGCSSFKINPIVTFGQAKRLEHTRVVLALQEMLAVAKRTSQWESQHHISVCFDGPPCLRSLRDALRDGVGACQFTNLLGVLANGTISYCGIGNSCPELVFGNILASGFDLERFWLEAPPLLSARRAISNRITGVCRDCVLERACKGSCRAFAYSEYKSLQAPHPWCQQAFDAGLFPAHLLVPA